MSENGPAVRWKTLRTVAGVLSGTDKRSCVACAGLVVGSAPGEHARFMNIGLVYADGSRIHLIPYDQLPLH
jgi:hypothetical protein